MMLYEDKQKENQQLKEKLDSIQQIQTAMLAYVLSQNHVQSSKKDTGSSSPTNGTTSQNSVIAGLPNFLFSIMGNPLGMLMQQAAPPKPDASILASLFGATIQPPQQISSPVQQVQMAASSESTRPSSHHQKAEVLASTSNGGGAFHHIQKQQAPLASAQSMGSTDFISQLQQRFAFSQAAAFPQQLMMPGASALFNTEAAFRAAGDEQNKQHKTPMQTANQNMIRLVGLPQAGFAQMGDRGASAQQRMSFQ
ncbi:hypothetical protein FGO68_gene2716 [Halteria grandinella]|uniref:Uncharacterized protein n=1 Tax=Halteria grandinella TaxID=5974 RepID=A0A8J8NWT2_HALGN|nr:hypothetical protein FGO68_gene2716 [Halteria grandinella]